MKNEIRPGFEGGLILPFKGVWPKIGDDVFIAPTATVIGDVEIADETVIMFGCTVRGDTNWIKIGKHSNLQDHVVIHVNAGKEPTSIGERVSVGHSVLLHACELQDGCLIGMRASVMDGAVIESGSFVAGGAVVVPRTVVKSGELWGGAPARFMRPLKEQEKEYLERVPDQYYRLGLQYRSEGIGHPSMAEN
jgi:carbonic anhydrase/acetyltransferase-like protein (isoleucine patch superfamily)